MPNPSHMSKELLEKLKNFADFAQVNISRAKFLLALGDSHQTQIEAIIQEDRAAEDAERLLSDDEEE